MQYTHFILNGIFNIFLKSYYEPITNIYNNNCSVYLENRILLFFILANSSITFVETFNNTELISLFRLILTLNYEDAYSIVIEVHKYISTLVIVKKLFSADADFTGLTPILVQ